MRERIRGGAADHRQPDQELSPLQIQEGQTLYSSPGAKDDKAVKADSGDDKAASKSADSKSESKKDSKSADTPKKKDKPSAKSKGGKAVA